MKQCIRSFIENKKQTKHAKNISSIINRIHIDESKIKYLKAEKKSFVVILHMTESCFSGTVSTNQVIVTQAIPSTARNNGNDFLALGDDTWNALIYQLLPLTKTSFIYLNQDINDIILFIYYNQNKYSFAMASTPWDVFAERQLEISDKKRQELLKVYFAFMAISLNKRNSAIESIMEKYIASQLKSSVYFIYKKFKDSNEKDNLKTLQQIYPDEICID